MPEVWAGQLGEIRVASLAGGGTALTTTPAFIQLPRTTNHIFITPRNFASACEVAQYSFNPWLVVLKTVDAMATQPTDYSEAAQDGSTDTDVVLTVLDTLANGDFVLVGSHLPFRGVYIVVDDGNDAGSATLSVYYWNGTWTDASATDGTNATATFAQSGLVYWAAKATWRMATLGELYSGCPSLPTTSNITLTTPMYWTRWSVSAILTATGTTFDGMVAANRSTVCSEWLSGQSFEAKIKHGVGGIGCIEARTDTGTANLVVNAATLRDGEFE